MRVFISSCDEYSIAIPMSSVSSIFITNGDYQREIDYNKNDQTLYISLPLLFNCPSRDVHYGVTLAKGEGIFNFKNSELDVKKTILLTRDIESEIDINDDYLFPIPRSLNTMRFSEFFGGFIFIRKNLYLLFKAENILKTPLRSSSHD